jgi:hypothetical protein
MYARYASINETPIAAAADRSIGPRDVFRRDDLCDIFIAAVSGSSFGLGFEAGYLLGATNKKVILLYCREIEKKVSLLISGNTHSNCTLVPYTSIAEVETFIHEQFASV